MRKTELKELYKMMFPDYPDILFRKAENSQTKLGHSLSRCYSSGAELSVYVIPHFFQKLLERTDGKNNKIFNFRTGENPLFYGLF